MKIYWRSDPGVYSSYLRFDLWKRYESNLGCRLLDRKPYLKPDAVVFQKRFSSKFREEARYWKKKGVLTVFDINVNYFELWGHIPPNLSQQQHDDAWSMARTVDLVTTTSPYLSEILEQRLDRPVHTITESIDLEYWSDTKDHVGSIKTLMLCSVASKIGALLLIKDVLEQVGREHGCELLLVSDKEIDLSIDIPKRWAKWDVAKAKGIFLQADLQVAPRDVSMSYNQGHSLTKIAQGMAMGIPAIGSAIRSYCDSPCLIAAKKEEWIESLMLLNNPDKRNSVGQESRDYVLENCDPQKNFEQFVRLLANY